MIELETCALADIPRNLLLLAEPDARRISLYPHDSRVFCARVEGRIAAVAVLAYRFARCSEIINIAVYPEYRGRNIGRLLLEACLQSARDLGHRRLVIQTASSSILQLGLYQRFGFRIVGISKNWFRRKYAGTIQENKILVRDRLRLELRLGSAKRAAKLVTAWKARLARAFELEEEPYVWLPRFGSYIANTEIALIQGGNKTGIALALDLVEAGALPRPGSHIVFCDGLGRPRCSAVVLKTSASTLENVPPAHAVAEGFLRDPIPEWLAWYSSFLVRKFEVLGMDFSPKSAVLLIEFKLLETDRWHF